MFEFVHIAYLTQSWVKTTQHFFRLIG